MIAIPPGFDVGLFAADLFTFGAAVAGVVGILATYRVIKKFGNRI